MAMCKMSNDPEWLWKDRPKDFRGRLFLTALMVLMGAAFVFNSFSYAGLEVEDRVVTDLEDIVVTGTSIPVALSKAAQSMTIIDKEDIAALPVNNIPDLLEMVSGVDVRQRGGSGVQADVSIRGGSFEQTLILVDGVNVSDPQTGHHNMNLPVNLEDIERIEILKGPGARVYGHNAMTGVINIITRDADQTRAGGGLAGGQYDFYRADGGLEGKTGRLSNRLSISRRASSGHIEDKETDFDIKTLNYRAGLKGANHQVRLGLGYTENDFGAYRFYSDVFPDQREKTETFLAHGDADIHLSDILVSPKVFWRRNQDDYKIDINGDWFKNAHQSDTYGTSMNSRFNNALGTTALGGEVTRENLESSNLGDHDRTRYGMFFEQKYPLTEKIVAGAGASAMNYTDWGWAYWPGADIQIDMAPGTSGYASAAKSFRVPTYTELFYNNPANRGNPDLKPESAWTYEIGIRRAKGGLGSTASLFYRDAQNLIDWVRKPGETTWWAENISKSKTRGIELGTDLYPGVLWNVAHNTVLNFSYTYMDADFDAGDFESKYILDQLRHQINGSIRVNWSDSWMQTFRARYEKRMVSNSHVVCDTRLAFHRNPWELFLDIANITDASYVDSGFAPAPGRWVVAGLRWDFTAR